MKVSLILLFVGSDHDITMEELIKGNKRKKKRGFEAEASHLPTFADDLSFPLAC